VHAYRSGAWTEDYLDETPQEGQVRVSVHRQIALVPVDDEFFVRRADPAMLASYLRSLGPRRVVRKVVSRRREAARNDTWLSVGLGTLADGSPVVFVVTTGPGAVERAVVDERLCAPAVGGPPPPGAPEHREPQPGAAAWADVSAQLQAVLEPLVGWRREAEPEVSVAPDSWALIDELLRRPPGRSFAVLPARPSPSVVRERLEATGPDDGDDGRPGFHLFGYGQYAKTQVIPNLSQRLRLECVHEINPFQLGPVADAGPVAWDTSGRPRDHEAIRNAAVAGYHHTHAPLAVELLDRGVRHVVVEKPIATTTGQLQDLLDAMARHPDARVHVAYQRRYLSFNPHLLGDLGGAPISMSATVFEVPLPARHWYRWPVVGNAVVSNGCHWIDHFLHLNDGSEVTHLHAQRLASQVVLAIELDNGASASISLRHEGSPRRGVRDRCTYWHGDATATIDDLRDYQAERGYRKLRARRAHPYRSLEDMYAEFARRIALDLPGDRIDVMRRSAATTLELARLVDEQR
jgi:predicted dehydrogenase